MAADRFLNLSPVPYIPCGGTRPNGSTFTLLNGTSSAEAFGRINATAADPFFASVVANAPPGAFGAIFTGATLPVTGVTLSNYDGIYLLSLPGGPALNAPTSVTSPTVSTRCWTADT